MSKSKRDPRFILNSSQGLLNQLIRFYLWENFQIRAKIWKKGKVKLRPTLGEIFSAKQTNPWVALEPLADESGGTIGGVVIENENFKIGVLATDQRLQAWLDSLFLVSGWNEDGNFRDGGRGLGYQRKPECPQVEQIIDKQET